MENSDALSLINKKQSHENLNQVNPAGEKMTGNSIREVETTLPAGVVCWGSLPALMMTGLLLIKKYFIMGLLFPDARPMTDIERAEYARLFGLLNQCTEVNVFECNGIMYKGYYPEAVMEFIKQNPEPADFHVWLQDNYKQL